MDQTGKGEFVLPNSSFRPFSTHNMRCPICKFWSSLVGGFGGLGSSCTNTFWTHNERSYLQIWSFTLIFTGFLGSSGLSWIFLRKHFVSGFENQCIAMVTDLIFSIMLHYLLDFDYFPLKKKFCGCIKSRAGIFCDACHPLKASPHIPPSLICVKSRIKFSTDATVMSPPCWPPIALQWRHRCVFARGCRVSSKFRWIIGYDQVDFRATLTQPTMQKITPYFHYRYQYFWFCLWCSWY